MFEALIALLVWGGLIYGLVALGRALKRSLRPRTANGVARSTAPSSPRPVDELDREVFARVRAQEQGTFSKPGPSPMPRPAAVEDREVSAWTKQGEAATTRLHQPVPAARSEVPDHLPVKVKGYFFSRSEQAFFRVLEEALPPGYRVFPNVRLNDLFLITAAPHQRQGTYARLRDKHVDFLVVSLPDHRPVFAIELDGASHDNAGQQYRDAVKDTAFRSAGLPLLRLRAEEQHTRQSLEVALKNHVWGVQAARQMVA